jgi:hypothetical protein
MSTSCALAYFSISILSSSLFFALPLEIKEIKWNASIQHKYASGSERKSNFSAQFSSILQVAERAVKATAIFCIHLY